MADTTVTFAKIRPTAVVPVKRISQNKFFRKNIAYDVYADFEEPFMIIGPHTTKAIPTGIACACEENYCLLTTETGSTTAKGVAQTVISPDFRDEIMILITNTTNHLIIICKDGCEVEHKKSDIIYRYEDAIAGLILIPVPDFDTEVISYEEFKRRYGDN